MKQTIFIFLFLVLPLFSQAQCEKSLTGKWVFKDIIGTEHFGEKELAVIKRMKNNEFTKSMFLEFKKLEGIYGGLEGKLIYFVIDLEGNFVTDSFKYAAWEIINDCSIIGLINTLGTENTDDDSYDEITIVKLTKNELTFTHGWGNEDPPYFLFEKASN